MEEEEASSWLVSVFEEFVLLRFAGGGIDFGVKGTETFFPDFVDKPRGKGAMFMSVCWDLFCRKVEMLSATTIAFAGPLKENRFLYCSPSQQQKCPF